MSAVGEDDADNGFAPFTATKSRPDQTRDQIKANLELLHCPGRGETLYVIADSGNELVDIEVAKGRVRWRPGAYPYTAFMRNCNLTNTPRCCRGMLCIFRDLADWSFSLGIVKNLAPLGCSKMEIYKWTGESAVDGGVFTPDFMFYAQSFPISLETVESNFTVVELTVDHISPPDVIFVNTVSSHPSVPLMHNCVNPSDDCFEMCPAGPDVMMTFGSIPNVVNDAPTIDASPRRQYEYSNHLFARNDDLSPASTVKTFACIREPKKAIHHVRHTHHIIERESTPRVDEAVAMKIGGLVAVPYVRVARVPLPLLFSRFLDQKEEIRFGFVERKNWRKMVSVGSQLVSDHNKMLDTMVVHTQRFRVLSLDRTTRDGFKVSIASKQERRFAENNFEDEENGEWVRDPSKDDLYTYDKDWAIPHWLAPGSVVLSVIKQRRVLSVPFDIVRYLWNTFGKAFGDRHVTKCCGINLYVSPRGAGGDTTRARVNTIEGPITIAHNTYWRENFKDVLAPQAYKLINELESVAIANMCMMDPIMVGACKDALGLSDKRKICSTAIVTAGSPTDGFGFCNSLHLDEHDKLSQEQSEELMEHLSGTEANLCGIFLYKKDYIDSWMRRFGCLSVPTTCAYEFLGSFSEEPSLIFAFFLLPAISLALMLQSGNALQFYGACLEHMTSAVLAVSKTHVHYKGEKCGVLAWGLGRKQNAAGGVGGGDGGGGVGGGDGGGGGGGGDGGGRGDGGGGGGGGDGDGQLFSDSEGASYVEIDGLEELGNNFDDSGESIQDESVASGHNHISNIVRDGLAAREHSSDEDVAVVGGGFADEALEDSRDISSTELVDTSEDED